MGQQATGGGKSNSEGSLGADIAAFSSHSAGQAGQPDRNAYLPAGVQLQPDGRPPITPDQYAQLAKPAVGTARAVRGKLSRQMQSC
ncbi:hypothetical protein [Mesorhizobium sp. CO1-1-8]|uniref:hypothetical protein n=1 Tax=Mesorhizobium sp. CO1-1-8 TaxID=2876631 RepID=UPI001CD0C603|nr:hypothetical protein [Mesorhizobium sp. CO1-1-8]MBZ9772953.1 hypothetical protein [Mesorhizobium sp. CO1-1-8]